MKEKEEWRQEEKEKLESDLKMMRRLVWDRTQRIQTLEEEVKTTKDRNSAYKWWLWLVIVESFGILNFIEILHSLPFPIWWTHAAVLVFGGGIWIGFFKKIGR